VNDLTWPQAKVLLGIRGHGKRTVGKPEPIGWIGVQDLYHRERAKIFAAMADARGLDLVGLADLPIDQLESAYLATSGRGRVDRLNLRAALLSFIELEKSRNHHHG
jgi:hypothetical protein